MNHSRGLEGDKSTKKGKREMKALRKWFGDKTQTEDDSTDGDDNEWGVIERRKRNNQRRKRTERKRKEREEQTLEKARHLFGPISNRRLNK